MISTYLLYRVGYHYDIITLYNMHFVHKDPPLLVSHCPSCLSLLPCKSPLLFSGFIHIHLKPRIEFDRKYSTSALGTESQYEFFRGYKPLI